MTLAAIDAPEAPPRRLFAEWMRREPLFAGATVVYLVGCLPVFFAMMVDDRTYLDVNIWAKPLKFLLSIVTFLGVIAWFAGWFPAEVRARLWYRLWAMIVVACATLELVWIIGASTFGIGSHFNTGSPLMAAAYTAAGIGAVTLLTAAPVVGILIARASAPLAPAFKTSVVLGLILTFPLTFVAAGYLGGAESHFVGGNASDAEGMILTGWARDGGDLRVAHFFALHAMHFIPAFGWLAAGAAPAALARPAIWAFTAAYVALTAHAFIGALNGQPFLPMIP